MPGSFSLMLHSHIPYCRKSGVWPAGEEWLFEALNETYIPLLRSLRRLLNDGIRPKITVGVVPILAEQLADGYMRGRFIEYQKDKIRRAESDVRRFAGDPKRKRVAEYWRERFSQNLDSYLNDFYADVLGSLAWLQNEGAIEVTTSAATHGFLPLFERDSAIFSQVRVGVETYRKYFGRDPRGFWLPECAYRPAEWSSGEGRVRSAIDDWLAHEGIRYFFVESVSITRANFLDNRYAEGAPSTYSGYRLASGVAVFGRNEPSGRQVWSPSGGYPGDPAYREFHQKDPESGLHYFRVTGSDNKEIYDPDHALERVESHAEHFAGLLRSELAGRVEEGRPGRIVVSPYDCELFGHWWHEGVDFIEALYRKLGDIGEVVPCSPEQYLASFGDRLSTIEMRPSSWGENSDFTVWRNPEHGWIWPLVNGSVRDLESVLGSISEPHDERGWRILRQLGRELLLMEGSDWPFLLYTAQAKEYANQRFHNHHQRFSRLLWAARDLGDYDRLSESDLAQIEDLDSPWSDLDVNQFRAR